MKLWDKGTNVDKTIEKFTIGNDAELDINLAPFDVLGNIAHITMLSDVGLMNKEDVAPLKQELVNIYNTAQKGEFEIEDGVEDVHSQIEYFYLLFSL